MVTNPTPPLPPFPPPTSHLPYPTPHLPNSHLIFNFCLAKLYTNSLMSSLNSRGGWGYSSQSQSTPAVSSGAKTFSGGRTVSGLMPLLCSIALTGYPQQVQVGQTTLTRPEVRRNGMAWLQWRILTSYVGLRPSGIARDDRPGRLALVLRLYLDTAEVMSVLLRSSLYA